jgi:glycosyltransferase involved in cell wall biosynthesis
MLVSVVIPAYNAEKWIAETIASVERQTYAYLEIIVIDDGSRDDTLARAQIALASSSRPHEVIKQENRGAAATRNRGVQIAAGDWIQFIDADDLLEPEKIAQQIACVAASPKCDIVYSDWRKLVFKDGAWAEHDMRRPLIGPNALADVLSDRHFLQVGCMLMRKAAIVAAGGFDTSHEPIEDVGLCAKIAIDGGVYLKAPSNGPVASYRDMPRSLSKLSHKKFIESCIKNAKLAERYVLSQKTPMPRVEEAIVNVYYDGARHYAGVDWARFEELVADIEVLRPRFIPKRPWRIRVLSAIAGYRSAERLAALYRRGKQLPTNSATSRKA